MMRRDKEKTVHIVHAVDTEGPLYESIEEIFDRLEHIFGIRLEATPENLKKVQNREIDFEGHEELVANTFCTHMVEFNDTWEKIDRMLRKIMAPEFRLRYPDSFGGGWIFNWHCLDHVGFEVNPRRRDMGYHRIFDHYRHMMSETGSDQDALHWHFHPMTVYKEAHRCATCFGNSPHLFEGICRRIIDRAWFPTVYRAGFHAERPDSHLFLEQWIPFDLTNIAMQDQKNVDLQRDQKGGRFGDWRLAPDDWSVYHPSHDNYQIPGGCRRWIARALNLKTRVSSINQFEVDKAFQRASEGLPTLLGVTNHDFRDMAHEIETFQTMLEVATSRFPDVAFKYCEAVDGFRRVVCPDALESASLGVDLQMTLRKSGCGVLLDIETLRGRVFGPQPFLAIKTKSGRYIHDNLDFNTNLKAWSYSFDMETVHPDDLEAVGVGCNDAYGNRFVKVIRIEEAFA